MVTRLDSRNVDLGVEQERGEIQDYGICIQNSGEIQFG
jgi:hypothetical protein